MQSLSQSCCSGRQQPAHHQQRGYLGCKRDARPRSCSLPLLATKRSKAFGELLVETDEPENLEQPPETDFWEGPQWEVIGSTAGFAVPLILVLLILVGFFAASNYNSGATAVLQTPKSPEDTARIVPKDN